MTILSPCPELSLTPPMMLRGRNRERFTQKQNISIIFSPSCFFKLPQKYVSTIICMFWYKQFQSLHSVVKADFWRDHVGCSAAKVKGEMIYGAFLMWTTTKVRFKQTCPEKLNKYRFIFKATTHKIPKTPVSYLDSHSLFLKPLLCDPQLHLQYETTLTLS